MSPTILESKVLSISPLYQHKQSKLSRPGTQALAITLSVVIHIVLLFKFGGSYTELNQDTTLHTPVRIKLVAHQYVTQQQQTKIQKTTVERKLLPEQVISKTNNKPNKQQASEQKQRSIEESVSSIPISSNKADPGLEEGLQSNQRQRYLAQILKHIESHKYYPTIARRRGVEGTVQVRFIMYSPNSMDSVHTTGASIQLQTAATTALRNAMPLPAPAGPIQFPLHIHYSMEYLLN